MSNRRWLMRGNNQSSAIATLRSQSWVHHAGEAIAGASFTRATIANQFSAAGLLTQAGSGVFRQAHYVGGLLTELVEPQRTNIAIAKRDMTNAAWVSGGGGITPAKDQTGIDGTANSCSSITAVGANGTIMQTVVLASSRRMYTAYVRRLVGTGTLEMTTDGGGTWTVVTTTTSFARVRIPSQVVTNPQFGFRIATAGDSFAIDWNQNEGGSKTESTPIGTMTLNAAAETRDADLYLVPVPALISVPKFFTAYVDGFSAGWGIDDTVIQMLLQISRQADTNCFRFGSNGLSTGNSTVRMGGAQTSTNRSGFGTVAQDDEMEARQVLAADASNPLGWTRNRGTEATATGAAPNPLDASWTTPTMYIGHDPVTAGREACFAYRKIVLAPFNQPLNILRQL